MAVIFGCSLPSSGPMSSPESLRSLAQRAEDLGFDSVWVSDHIVVPRQVESFYPYAPDGVATFSPDETYFEPLAALNFLAGCTHRVRLGTHVLILPYRNPVLTAKILATLDVLSGGRVILGAGVGWMEEEFQALGWIPTTNGARSPTSTYSYSKSCGPRTSRSSRESIIKSPGRRSNPNRCRNLIRPSGSEAILDRRSAAPRNTVTDGCP